MRKYKYNHRSRGEKPKETGEICPKCERPLVTKINSIKGTEFIACSGYPDCKYTCNVGPDYRSRLEKVLDLFRSEYKWEPDCDSKVYSLLEKIYIYEPQNKKKTSNDEIMFLIGAFHCIDKSFGDPKNQIHIYLDYVLHIGMATARHQQWLSFPRVNLLDIQTNIMIS